MSALVLAWVLAPVPEPDAAGLARHSLTAGGRWSEGVLIDTAADIFSLGQRAQAASSRRPGNLSSGLTKRTGL
jgi:hypothetical protein